MREEVLSEMFENYKDSSDSSFGEDIEDDEAD